ncbi:MAG: class F sortase [Candidatus Nomurabacteria bacterium]|jgi:sortase (surface protein transpeptidase)|nr:class F sortase [Candidatus Nomurabacteria bacterium]
MAKKPNKKPSRKIVRVLLFILLVATMAVGSFFVLKFIIPPLVAPVETVQTAENSENIKDESEPDGDWTVAPEKPRFMTIKALGIDKARVVELGVKGENNQLEDPKNIHDAGWYRDSALPGAPVDTEYAGLYDGHNTGVSQKGIFFYLDRLTIGDEIVIERGDAAELRYAVREVETVLLEEIDMSKMQKSFNPQIEGLNIISCGGDWDKERQTYTHRVTVRATIK